MQISELNLTPDIPSQQNFISPDSILHRCRLTMQRPIGSWRTSVMGGWSERSKAIRVTNQVAERRLGDQLNGRQPNGRHLLDEFWQRSDMNRVIWMTHVWTINCNRFHEVDRYYQAINKHCTSFWSEPSRLADALLAADNSSGRSGTGKKRKT